MNLHNDDGTLNEAGQKIVDILDSKEFMSDLYEGLDEKTRDELGQFYTPAKICIQMIEMFKATEFSGKNILDPCCGSGNLLIAMLAAGADSDKIYGNDYDERAVKLCRKRINRACDILGKPYIQDWQIHQGNALHEFALTYFGNDYKDYYFGNVKEDYAKARRLNNLRQVKLTGSLNLQEYELDYNIYSSIKFKEAHPQEYNEHLLSVNNRIRKETAEVTDKSFTGDLW